MTTKTRSLMLALLALLSLRPVLTASARALPGGGQERAGLVAALPGAAALPLTLAVALPTFEALTRASALPAAALMPALLPDHEGSFGHDYEVRHAGWNGLSELSALAAELGCPLEARPTLDWDTLDGHDVLFFAYPQTPIPERELVGFLSAGGRAVVADDFGQGQGALRALRIERIAGAPQGAATYRDNPALPIASAVRGTLLGQATPTLITNHPGYFVSALPATYAFSPKESLVIEGSLGRGRFVAIAEPSLFINNMLQLPGNRDFAARLIADLCRPGPPPRDRLLLFHGPFTLHGTPPAVLPGAPATGLFDDVPDRWNRALSGANLHIQETLSRDRFRIGLDAAALSGLALAVAVLLLLLRYLPLSPVSHDASFAQPARPPEVGLFSTMLRHAAADVPWGHVFPAALLREEVLARLAPYLPVGGQGLGLGLGIHGPVALRPALVKQVLGVQLEPRLARHVAALWGELRDLPGPGEAGDNGEGAMRGAVNAWVSRRRLRKLHRMAIAVFAELDAIKDDAGSR